MFCKNCGKELENTVKYCPDCGTPVRTVNTVKSKAAIIVLILVGGYLGLHKFYVGKKREGIVYLLGGIISIFMLFELAVEFQYILDDPFLVVISILPSLFMGIALLIDLVKTLEN